MQKNIWQSGNKAVATSAAAENPLFQKKLPKLIFQKHIANISQKKARYTSNEETKESELTGIRLPEAADDLQQNLNKMKRRLKR